MDFSSYPQPDNCIKGVRFLSLKPLERRLLRNILIEEYLQSEAFELSCEQSECLELILVTILNPVLTKAEEGILKIVENLDIKYLSLFDAPTSSSPYPSQFLHLHEPPVGIFVRGSLEAFSKTKIAVVGSRQADSEGIKVTESFCRELAINGNVIVSGLAKGVDEAAHRGALNSQQLSSTIAVLAHGVDSVYPSSNRGLARDIVESGGALISEYPPTVLPLKHQFLERNRIIAALAEATIITQAAEKSGALVTASQALELGREIYAMPWSILNEKGRGCLRLLRDGAHILTAKSDLETYLPLLMERRGGVEREAIKETLDPLARQILTFVSTHNPIHYDVVMSEFSEHSDFFEKFYLLEEGGWIEKESGNFLVVRN